MTPEYDAVVVGARCAGSMVAASLAGAGHSVLMVDSAPWPSDTMSTLYLHPPGVALLSRLGVLDDVRDSGCPPIRSMTHSLDGCSLAGPLPAFAGIDYGLAPRRYVLDQLSAARACELGADFWQRTKFLDVLWDGARAAGARVRSPDGTHDVRARVVIGADGMRSAVAAAVGARTYRDDGRRTFVHYTGWHDLDVEEVRLHEVEGAYVSVIPTHHRSWLVATFNRQEHFARARSDPMAHHLACVRAVAPDVARRMATSEQVVKLHGSGDQQNFFRTAGGPGWALVGDAGHHKDSITARGITDAMAQAELLGDLLAGRLDEDEATDDAVQEFGAMREALLADSYHQTLTVAELRVSERRAEMHALMAGSAELTQGYLRVAAGIDPTSSLAGLVHRRDR